MRMPNQERVGFWALWMQRVSRLHEEVVAGKADIRAAVNGLDDFVEAHQAEMDAAEQDGTLRQWVIDNRAAINQAIPQPARATLTLAQKEFLARAVYRRDAENGA